MERVPVSLQPIVGALLQGAIQNVEYSRMALRGGREIRAVLSEIAGAQSMLEEAIAIVQAIGRRPDPRKPRAQRWTD